LAAREWVGQVRGGLSGVRLRLRRRFRGPHANYWGFLFVLPILLFFIVFKFWPILQAFWLSFTDANLVGDQENFIGLENYSKLMQDSQFLRSLRITGYYVFGTVIPLTVLSLGLAVLLNQKIKGKGFFRVMLFLPALVPIIVVPILWRFLYHPYGLVNEVVKVFGFEPISWLTSEAAVIPAFIIATEWRFVPLFMVIYLAGLQGIPEELYDAARVDGASTWQRFRRVTLPLLRPTIVVVVVMSVTMTAKSLVLSLVMTGGNPNGASRLLSLFIFEQGFRNQRIGYASAASIVLLLIIIAFAAINLRLSRESEG
jgi:ABC-type sugar transport system permease subunit